jgi:hypothetical protein
MSGLNTFFNQTLKSYTEKLFKEVTKPSLYSIIVEKEKQQELNQLEADLSLYSRQELINACIGSYIFSYELNKEKEKLEKEINNLKEDGNKLEQIKNIIGYYIDEEY